VTGESIVVLPRSILSSFEAARFSQDRRSSGGEHTELLAIFLSRQWGFLSILSRAEFLPAHVIPLRLRLSSHVKRSTLNREATPMVLLLKGSDSDQLFTLLWFSLTL